jgi:hypothetical protein
MVPGRLEGPGGFDRCLANRLAFMNRLEKSNDKNYWPDGQVDRASHDLEPRRTLAGHVEASLQREACAADRPFVEQAPDQSDAVWDAPRR